MKNLIKYLFEESVLFFAIAITVLMFGGFFFGIWVADHVHINF